MEYSSEKITELIEYRKITPLHCFCASLLGVISELITAPQELINAVMKNHSTKLYDILKAEGHLKENYTNFEEFVGDVNNGLGISDNIKVFLENDQINIWIKTNACKFCPKSIGMAEINRMACPIPIMFEIMGEKAGYNITPVKKGEEYLIKEDGWCKIKYTFNNTNKTEKREEIFPFSP
ncbi:MAG: hypothetical protein PWP15_1630 [Methanothermococcus sp.]|uniref:hypothetical protein n=1 Tax=Methanothermococcus TaxID=155862 RepID=UPI00037E5D75|nr:MULTISPECIES: hypothetical protein [Methanothermococcus]MDK2791110.1 hypothetical protein [Methanothermococcus sp.]MDK2988257.1 hypothetical protein [Methanothermococcus sp.]